MGIHLFRRCFGAHYSALATPAMAIALRNSFCSRHTGFGFFDIPHELAEDFMNFQDRIKGFGIAVALLIGCFPVAVAITIIASPFWSWFEERFRIEAYGHTGPAEWCYLILYILLITISALIWARCRKLAEMRG